MLYASQLSSNSYPTASPALFAIFRIGQSVTVVSVVVVEVESVVVNAVTPAFEHAS